MGVVGWVTGPDLLERVELVRSALPEADRVPFAQNLDEALDSARLTRNLGRLGQVVEGVVAGGVRSRAGRWAATEARLRQAEALEWGSEPLEVEDAISRYLS